jgi:hypothetical protein
MRLAYWSTVTAGVALGTRWMWFAGFVVLLLPIKRRTGTS